MEKGLLSGAVLFILLTVLYRKKNKCATNLPGMKNS
jgi:hypothetical protein